MCGEGWKIRENYRKYQTPEAKAALATHIRTCPECHAQWASIQPGYETRSDDEIAAACGIPVELPAKVNA